MNSTLHTCIDIVCWGDTIQVIYIGFQRQQEQHCGLTRDRRDLQASRAYLQNLVIILLDPLVGGGGVDGRHVRGLQARERIKKAITYVFTPVDFFRDLEGLNLGASSTRLACANVCK